MHLELSGFDFQNGIYYYNVGEGKNSHRNWDDYVKYNFIFRLVKESDGEMQCLVSKLVILSLPILKHYGYVGVGQILSKAEMIKNVVLMVNRFWI